MKKVFKNKQFILIIIAIIFLSIGIKATTLYYSNQVSYTPTDTNWNVNNVADALNDLRSIKQQLDNIKVFGDASASDIKLGKTAIVKGEEITGTQKTFNSISGSIYAVRHNKGSGLTGKAYFNDLPPCTLTLTFARGNSSSNFSFLIQNNGIQINSGNAAGTFELNEEQNDLYIYTWQNISDSVAGSSDFTINYTITLK